MLYKWKQWVFSQKGYPMFFFVLLYVFIFCLWSLCGFFIVSPCFFKCSWRKPEEIMRKVWKNNNRKKWRSWPQSSIRLEDGRGHPFQGSFGYIVYPCALGRLWAKDCIPKIRRQMIQQLFWKGLVHNRRKGGHQFRKNLNHHTKYKLHHLARFFFLQKEHQPLYY